MGRVSSFSAQNQEAYEYRRPTVSEADEACMSGIFGIINLDGAPVTRPDMQSMAATLQRRGPDGTGIWHEGPVGLGHTMLRTTPESLHECPPVQNQRGDLVITADVRLDNRDESDRCLGSARSFSQRNRRSGANSACLRQVGRGLSDQTVGRICVCDLGPTRTKHFFVREITSASSR